MKKITEYEQLDRKVNKMNLLIICIGILAVMAIGFVYSSRLHVQDQPSMSVAGELVLDQESL